MKGHGKGLSLTGEAEKLREDLAEGCLEQGSYGRPQAELAGGEGSEAEEGGG